MRLDKFLAECGAGSRKDCRLYIKDGLVTVNNETIIEPSLEIDELMDKIVCNNESIVYRKKVYYMFNKPKGCVTARKDDEFKTVFDYFKAEDMRGINHVGRLDKDTEGMLLLTNDGDFNHALMNPEKHISKKILFYSFRKHNRRKEKCD